MAYYYDQDGNKIPVDDHSTPEQKDLAAQQEQANARAANGDTNAGGDANGVQAPGAAGQVDNSSKVVDGPLGNTQGTGVTQAQKDAIAAAKAAAAAQANYLGHYQYGGYANGANDASNRYRQEGEAAQGRAAPQIDYGVANDDHNRNVITSQSQNQLAGLLAARANGSMPSIAGMRANQDINRALADQTSIAASARGPAALALAQQNQANNSASAMGNISNSAQINTAQEQLNNTVAAGQAYTGIRQGDQALQAQDAAQATAQGQLNEAQRDANDRYQLGMTGFETGVQGAQLQAQGNQIAGERGAYATQQGIDLAHDQNSTAKTAPWISGGLGAGAAVGGAIVAGLLGGGGSQGGVGTGPAANGTIPGGTSAGPGSVVGASAGTDSGTTGVGSGIGTTPNVTDVGTAGAGFMPQSTQMFKAPTSAAIPGEPVMPQTSGTSDDRAKVPVSLSTTSTDTTGPASSSVSMARILAAHDAARDAEAARKAKAEKYGGLVSGVIGGIGKAFEQQPQQAHITPVQPQMQQITLSDDRTKLAAAWDQGHNAALDKVQQMRTMSPDELKALGAKGNRLANAVRGAKADAYDEALGQNQSMTGPMPVRQPTSFTRNDADYAAPPPPPMPADVAPVDGPVALSDDRTKLSMSSALGSRQQVGTLGKSVSNDDASDFARSLRSTPYSYKDGYAQREGQQPGEVNVGPVAQDVERSKIGATIVKPDPQGSGMRTLDQSKMVKGLGAVAASHQDQLDEHDRKLSLMARRLGGGR